MFSVKSFILLSICVYYLQSAVCSPVNEVRIETVFESAQQNGSKLSCITALIANIWILYLNNIRSNKYENER